jgi:hypothetical protein
MIPATGLTLPFQESIDDKNNAFEPCGNATANLVTDQAGRGRDLRACMRRHRQTEWPLTSLQLTISCQAKKHFAVLEFIVT